MTAAQFDRLKAELEETYTGAKNAGRPMLLEGGLDWKAMSLSPRATLFDWRSAPGTSSP
jgi:phage portal protein BeeE